MINRQEHWRLAISRPSSSFGIRTVEKSHAPMRTHETKKWHTEKKNISWMENEIKKQLDGLRNGKYRNGISSWKSFLLREFLKLEVISAGFKHFVNWIETKRFFYLMNSLFRRYCEPKNFEVEFGPFIKQKWIFKNPWW